LLGTELHALDEARDKPLAVGLREPAVGLHGSSIADPRLEGQPGRQIIRMLRKALWTGLYAGIGAASTIAARRVASKVWRVATGEEPPTKK
jgi:hypothetical protein